ncbi:MAG: acyl-ACP--UDP-N-acetylglucosamine O-acyltransferase [Verrucomicrobiota bacterium]
MGTKIHSTAIVDPGAEIGEDVEIGPYCVIYAGVKLGDGCWLQNHVTIDGGTTIGTGNQFYAYASIGQKTQDVKYAGEPTYCDIGDNNVFREFVSVHRGTGQEDRTVIGNENKFLAYCHIGHDCKVGNHIISSNNGTLGGHCIVEDHVILGGMTGVHQFCRIGKHAFTGGCTKIVRDVPPFMMVDGNPAKVRTINQVGLERRGFSEAAIRVAKEAQRLLYRKNLNVKQAIDEIEKMEDVDGVLEDLLGFIRASDRNIIR